MPVKMFVCQICGKIRPVADRGYLGYPDPDDPKTTIRVEYCFTDPNCSKGVHQASKEGKKKFDY